MEKLEIKLKECCLTCESFFLDNGTLGVMGCGPSGPRELRCLHMPVCGMYQAAGDTLVSKSWGGGKTPRNR